MMLHGGLIMSRRLLIHGGFVLLWLVSAYYAYIVFAFRGIGELFDPLRARYSDPDLERVQTQLIAFQTDTMPFVLIGAVVVSAIFAFTRQIVLAYVAVLTGVAGTLLLTRLVWWWLPNPVT